jgi:hypothetical protein
MGLGFVFVLTEPNPHGALFDINLLDVAVSMKLMA